LLATAFAVFVFTLLLTHFLPIPGGVKALHMNLNNQKLFDQKPSFSESEIYQRIESFGEMGRESYKLFTYTSDFIFPLSLLFFLFVLYKFSEERAALGNIARTTMKLIPLFWFAIDLFENILIYFLLTTFPTEHSLAALLGYVTVLKFILLFGSLTFPVIAYIAFRKTIAPQHRLSA
jgi:hypothetical protein